MWHRIALGRRPETVTATPQPLRRLRIGIRRLFQAPHWPCDVLVVTGRRSSRRHRTFMSIERPCFGAPTGAATGRPGRREGFGFRHEPSFLRRCKPILRWPAGAVETAGTVRTTGMRGLLKTIRRTIKTPGRTTHRRTIKTIAGRTVKPIVVSIEPTRWGAVATGWPASERVVIIRSTGKVSETFAVVGPQVSEAFAVVGDR